MDTTDVRSILEQSRKIEVKEITTLSFLAVDLLESPLL
jgi:hypothetical protein